MSPALTTYTSDWGLGDGVVVGVAVSAIVAVSVGVGVGVDVVSEVAVATVVEVSVGVAVGTTAVVETEVGVGMMIVGCTRWGVGVGAIATSSVIGVIRAGNMFANISPAAPTIPRPFPKKSQRPNKIIRLKAMTHLSIRHGFNSRPQWGQTVRPAGARCKPWLHRIYFDAFGAVAPHVGQMACPSGI